MPQKKTEAADKNSAKKNSRKKNSEQERKKTQKSASDKISKQENVREAEPGSLSAAAQILPFVIAIAAVFILACLILRGGMGAIGNAIGDLFCGLFSWSAMTVPFFMLIIAFFFRKDCENKKYTGRILSALACVICLAVLSYAFAHHSYEGDSYRFDFSMWWKEGLENKAGGVIGGFIGFCLHKLISYVGTLIVGFALLFVFVLCVFDLTPYSLFLTIRYKIHMHMENVRTEKERFEETHPYTVPAQHRQSCAKEPEYYADEQEKEPKYDPDVDLDEEEKLSAGSGPLPTDSDVFERIVGENQNCVTYDASVPPFDADVKDSVVIGGSVLSRKGDAEEPIAEELPTDLKGIFSDEGDDNGNEAFAEIIDSDDEEAAAELEMEKHPLAEKKEPEQKKQTRSVYKFPPLSLLHAAEEQNSADYKKELAETSAKLVRTLDSFKVKTKIINISRGPTITRYELAPEEGVRVRTITNLVDDIALNLAATGVRIEAPIPGKQAVGIEVPNRNSSTVYLRGLIDTPKFKQATSKVHCALGEDVAGEPIYLDVAKMPHLLIAGATGMGKSVCINSIIMSMLYKASPDDVKLMLIDPKKVEFTLYNDLPHLLIPPVSEPKRAAGALQWAVAEMERRYSLIEDVGVRNISSYNQATANDPDREHLPLIVIIIDELADLMMSAKDIVEEAICRLAQKARAAGIHIVIGTQRPSIDVVTGLIKANIPSRIAFTVASITDSRVILDYGGAEKLIGKGDMLFAPVGSPKPIRVQGAFVSDEEVESVVNYIKDNFGALEYDENIVDEINEMAKRCESEKKGGAVDADISGADAEDPMLKPAIELAVESGKISTSLIQRKLSLGYGRAAKLIDAMEARGIVSAPEGQKPRTVLMTKEQYMEKVLRDEGF